MSSRFFIYGLIDPSDGVVRYVGKSYTGMVRPKTHLMPSRLAERSHKAHWIRSVLSLGRRPAIVILEELEQPEGLNEAECFYISYLNWLGCRLTNATIGGDGAPGHRASAETRAKMSAVRKGRTQSPEHLAARSAALKGHAVSDETRQKIANAHKGNKYCVGRKLSVESRAKMSESVARTAPNRGKKLSAETRAKMSAARKLREINRKETV